MMPIKIVGNCFVKHLSLKKTFSNSYKCFTRMFSASITRPVVLSHTIYDPPSPSDKPPFIMAHGLLGSKMNWNSIAKAVVKSTNRKVVTFDARNHGDSPHIDEMNYSEMSKDLMDLAHHLNIPKFSLLGHSMGGRTVMTFTLTQPEFIEKLIVVDVSPINIGADFSEMEGYLKGLLNLKFEPNVTLSNARKMADKELESVTENKSLRAFFLTNLAINEQGIHWKPNLNVLLKYLHEIGKFPAAVKSKSISNPTLFIRGERSPYIPESDFDGIKTIFTSSKIETMKNCGHWCHADNPALFLSILTSFLNSN